MPISTIPAAGLSSGVPTRAQLPAGCILQVVQAVKTDSQIITSTSLVDITGLSVTITPTSATSKFMVWGDVASSGANGNFILFQLVRNATNIYLGTESRTYVASRVWYPNSVGGQDNATLGTSTMMFLDSPATGAAITYKIQARVTSGASAGINRRIDNDTSLASSLTIMEVAA